MRRGRSAVEIGRGEMDRESCRGGVTFRFDEKSRRLASNGERPGLLTGDLVADFREARSDDLFEDLPEDFELALLKSDRRSGRLKRSSRLTTRRCDVEAVL